jgi:hypothetical protein
MTVPTLRAHKFFGTGSAQVFDLLLGTTLGSQIGSNFSALESFNATYKRAGANYVEFRGKEYVINNTSIRERNQGGTGVWGAAHTFLSTPSTYQHTGLHIVHPKGVPTMVCSYTGGAPTYVVRTIDGALFTETSLGSAGPHLKSSPGITYRDSLFWQGGNAVTGGGMNTVMYDFNLDTFIYTALTGNADGGGVLPDLFVSKHQLFMTMVTWDTVPTSVWELWRWGGSSWSKILNFATGVQVHSAGNNGGGSCMFEDPTSGDLICICPGQNVSAQEGEQFVRIQNQDTSPVETNITSVVLQSKYRPGGGSGNSGAQWYSMIDNDTDPVNPTVYLFRLPGNGLAGSYRVFQWNGFGDGSTPDSSLMTNPVTSSTVDGAGSLSYDFSICSFKEGIGERLPTVLASPTTQGARAELGVNVVQLTHGAVTNPPFNLNETVTGVGGATGTILIDNTGSLTVFPTNSTAFINGEVITGTGGAFATLSSGPTNSSAPPIEVSGGTKCYFQVYGDSPSTVSITLHFNITEGAPETRGTIVSVALESGSPATAPSVSGNAIINMTPDLGVCLWSVVQDSVADGFSVGDVVEIALRAT